VCVIGSADGHTLADVDGAADTVTPPAKSCHEMVDTRWIAKSTYYLTRWVDRCGPYKSMASHRRVSSSTAAIPSPSPSHGGKSGCGDSDDPCYRVASAPARLSFSQLSTGPLTEFSIPCQFLFRNWHPSGHGLDGCLGNGPLRPFPTIHVRNGMSIGPPSC
jgi:hypothetical protein